MKWLYLPLLILFIACSETKVAETDNDLNLEPQKPEPDFCSNVIVPNDPVTLSGSATYQKRELTSSGLGGPSSARPIRYAEIAVLDSSGNVLQCGESDGSGNFSINIERTSKDVLVEVRSRANKVSKIKASVLDDHENVSYHAIRSSAVSGNTNQNLGTINAPHNGSLEGGAFHILDLIFEANEFLRSKTTTCDGTECPQISVADKVSVFWKKGFNPATYLGYDADNTLSFYLSGTSRLYILGGVNGDTDNTDTDHFDDIIVLHEYGHFIEDRYSIADSPGGSHNGNSIIDPRLAWSEGWATYFATEVAAYPYYHDTEGNTSGSTSNLIYYNIENDSPKRDPSSISYTEKDGEGVFREFAISRALMDATDTDASDDDNDGYEAGFGEFWTIFSGNSYFKNSSLAFRFAGKFFQFHESLGGRTDIKPLLESEFIYKSGSADFLDHYAQDGNNSGSCGTWPFSITPADGNSKKEDGSFENSNLYASNDFFEYNHSGGTLAITLEHDGNQDLDLYLYKKDYVYADLDTILDYSESTTSTTESISPSLSSGKYMVNIRAFPTFVGGILDTTTANYDLTIKSSQVCP